MQSGISKIWKNSIFVFFSQFIRLLTNFLIFIAIARLYGPEEFGQFSIAFTIANICIIIADFGFDVLLTTEIAKDLNNAVSIGRRYFSLKIVFVSVSLLIMIIISSFETFSENSRMLIYSLTLYVMFTTLMNFFYAIFRGFQKFEFETKVSFITNSSLLIFIGILGLLNASILELMLAFVVARGIGLYISISKITKLVGANILKINFENWRFIIGQVMIFGFHFLFGNLFFQLDTILLGIWDSDYAVGIYQSAFKIMLLLLIIPDIAINSVLPVLSRLYIESIEKWREFSKLLYKLILFIALPIALILFFYSEKIVFLIYGSTQFSEAIPVLKIFAFVVLIRFAAEPFALMITTSKRQIIRMIIVIIATTLSFALNFFVIPTYGFYGAGMVSLGVNLLVAFLYFSVYWKYFIRWTFELRTIIMVLTILFFVLILIYLKSAFYLIPVIIVFYLIEVYFLGFVSEERKLIFSKFSFNRN